MSLKNYFLSAGILCFFYPSFSQKSGGQNCTYLPGDFTYDFNACDQSQINFTNTSFTHKNVTWIFGDGTFGSGDSVVHDYTSQGIYTVEMVGKNIDGCVDTIIKQFAINIIHGEIYEDKSVNACINGTTHLEGDSTALDNCWSPATYLDSVDIYDPLIDPKSNVTYQYNEVKKGTNIITNGNFEGGNTNFLSQYIYDSAINSNGYYYITSNPQLWNSSYAICPYDSSFLDTMMLVNGSTVPKTIVWSKRISVLANTNYQFIFHSAVLVATDSLVLECNFNNGEIINQFLLPSMTCFEKKYRITWFSGSDTSLYIKFYDLDTDSAANAFTLNNFSLYPVYLETDSLTAEVVPIPKISVSGDATICAGDSTMLNANSLTGTQYQWAPAKTLNNADIASPAASPIKSTTYFVTVTDSNYCSNTDSVVINVVPKAMLSVPQDTLSICKGDSTKLIINASNTNAYDWSPGKYVSDSTIAQPIAFTSTSTKFFLIAGNGVCTAIDSIYVNVMTLPVVGITNDTSICKTGTLQLNASGGINYYWYPANGLSDTTISNPFANINNPIKYFVQVTGNNNCMATDSVFISVDTVHLFGVQPMTAAICAGDTVSLKAFGGNVFAWSPSASVADPSNAIAQVFPVVNTTYEVQIIDTSCHVSDSLFTVVTVKPQPNTTISKSNDVDCILGTSQLQATGGISYSWSPTNSLSNAKASNPLASPFQTTTYYVKILGDDGCYGQDSITVFANTGNVSNGYLVPSAFTPNGDGNNDCFGIKEWGSVSDLNFSIYNRWGTLIFHTSNISECWDGTYKGLMQPTGTYIYQIHGKTLCGNILRKGVVVLIR